VLKCVVAVCCSVLQCVAVCCSVRQCNTVRCSAVQCVAVRCSHLTMLSAQNTCSVLQCAAVCCSVLQCVVVCCSELQCALQVCCSHFRILPSQNTCVHVKYGWVCHVCMSQLTYEWVISHHSRRSSGWKSLRFSECLLQFVGFTQQRDLWLGPQCCWNSCNRNDCGPDLLLPWYE